MAGKLVGSGAVIRQAGPGVLISYVVAGCAGRSTCVGDA